jgi:tRNA(adenine34) deaminase
VVWAYEDAMGGGTRCDRSTLPPLYRDRRITVVPRVLRGRSLALFQTFFRNPDNGYWAGSLLAEYTLAQETED